MQKITRNTQKINIADYIIYRAQKSPCQKLGWGIAFHSIFFNGYVPYQSSCLEGLEYV